MVFWTSRQWGNVWLYMMTNHVTVTNLLTKPQETFILKNIVHHINIIVILDL